MPTFYNYTENGVVYSFDDVFVPSELFYREGDLWVWGNNASGQLGTNDLVNRSVPVNTFIGGTNWKQVSAGYSHSAAIKTDGTLWTWGTGSSGELGDNSVVGKSTPVTTFSGGTNWRQVGVGNNFTVALKTDGTLWTWGLGANGILGNNATTNRSTPVTTFIGKNNWTKISVGYRHTLALDSNEILWSWGTGSYGKLGNNTTFDRSTPATVFGQSRDWAQINPNGNSGVKTDGTLWVWGSGLRGLTGTSEIRYTPVTTFVGGNNWKQVDGQFGLKTDGTLWVWGTSAYITGAFGLLSVSVPVTTFAGGNNWADAPTAEPEDLYTLSTGNQNTAAIKTDGTLWVWGNGAYGQLGINDTINRSTPVTTFEGGSDWKQISTSNHTSAIKTDGTLWTWGNSFSGQLGRIVTDATQRSFPIIISGKNWADTPTVAPEDLYTLSAGQNFSVAIKTDGTLWTWGNGGVGGLGTNDLINRSTPVTTFVGGNNWKQVSTSSQHTVAIKTDGTLWTWGNGGWASTYVGQLGNNETTSRSTPVTTFIGGTDWKQVSAGGYSVSFHTAAIKTDGTLWTWGSNTSLGRVVYSNLVPYPVTTFAGGNNWSDAPTSEPDDLYTLSAGGGSGAIKTDGTLWIWGPSTNGALGTNNLISRSTPVTTFAGGTNWKQISVGRNGTTVAIKTDGTLWTWGYGNFGRLGTNDQINRSTPVTTFAGGNNWKQAFAGGAHTAAIKTDGTLWLWGRNLYRGNLGTNDTFNRLTPVTTFVGGTNWKQVSCGGYQTTAAVKTDGTLWTWGYTASGVLGRPTGGASNVELFPVTTFAGGNNWADTATAEPDDLYTLSAGINFSTAVKTDGTLWTWGIGGNDGRLGNNAITDRSTPITTFSGGTNWKQVSAGSNHTSGIKTDGTLWVWGSNANSQLGTNDSTSINRSTPVTTFVGGNNWKQVSAGYKFTSAIKTDGTLWTWGYSNNGVLGRITTSSSLLVPETTFAGGNNWADTATAEPDDLYTLSAGLSFSTAVKTDGTLWTWGNGTNGRLGTNDAIIKSTPVTTFSGGTNWKQISAGSANVVAVKTDGTLWTWGYGTYGRLGTNDVTQRQTPVTTFAGGTNWKHVSTSGGSVFATKTDGTLWSWGNNASGQLGRNTSNSQRIPVTTFAGGNNWADTATGAEDELYTLVASNSSSFAIKTDGTLWVWGSNVFTNLGTNDATQRNTPVTTFAGGNNWKQISCANTFTSAIKTDGTLWTWGNGSYGRLGTNDTINRSTPVTTFAGGTNWKQVGSSTLHSVAVKTDGTLWVWGNGGFGRLGTNDTINRLTPVTTFAGGTNWKHVSAGYITAAIKTDGTLWTWGSGANGVLGTNDLSVNRSTPVTTFAGGINWKQVSVSFTSLTSIKAIKTDGTLWTWGYGGSGINGTNDTSNKLTPVTTFAGGNNWKQVSVCSQHTSAVKTDGTLWTWGVGSSGQLGSGDQIARSTPVTTFIGGTNWKQVSAGANYTLALNDDGVNKQLYVFGDNTNGSLGVNVITASSQSIPSEVFGQATNWKQVSAGINHTAAIKTDGTLWVWGANFNTQLGTNDTIDRVVPVTTFVGGTNWKQVSCGFSVTAAIKTDGTLWVWGNGGSGRLGNNDTTNRSTPVTTFAGGTNWKQVSASSAQTGTGGHTAAVKTDGTLWVWGGNSFSQLGNGSTNNVSTPITTFAGGTNWKQVSAGFDHTIALQDDGVNKQLYVFGNNSFSQLGLNVLPISTSIPIQVFGRNTNWKQVSSGNSNTSAVKTDGTLWIWGSGSYGALGTNDINVSRATPVTTFAGGTNWKQTSSGRFYTAAVKTDGTLWTWGNGGTGKLGTNDLINRSTPVTTFAGGTNWKQVSSSLSSSNSYHITAVKTDGTLWTWGYNNKGQLGTNDTLNRSTPVTTIAGGTNWKQVSAGGDHTLALNDDGVNKRLYAFGDNSNVELGINFYSNSPSIPQEIAPRGLSNGWKQVSTGGRQMAAVKTDGTLWTWGRSDAGQLGNNDTTNRDTPVTTFVGGNNWKQVSAGYNHSSAIKTDGTLWVWGNGGSGRLGTNDTNNRSTPVQTLIGGTNWKQVNAGNEHTLALQDDGVNKRLYVFGSDSTGQLGTNGVGAFNSQSIPVAIIGSSNNWKQVSTGYNYTMAVKTDGTLWGWGSGGSGQLGANNSSSATPITTFVGGNNWKQVSCGRNQTAAIKTDGSLWSWGNNSYGLGRLIITYENIPSTTFSGGNNWADTPTTESDDLFTISAGTNSNLDAQSSAIKTDGTLWVWGRNYRGALGTNDTITRSTPVTTFAGGTNWRQISSGDRHRAAIKTDGTLWTWGYNSSGRLGNNNTTILGSSTPITTFAGGNNWKQVSSGSTRTAAIKTDGTLWVWGNNSNGIYNGHLGINIGSVVDRITPVTTFAGGNNWKQVSVGTKQIAAVKTDGTLWTWGTPDNDSGLGRPISATNQQLIPVTTFAGGTNWADTSTTEPDDLFTLSAGQNFSVALKTDGTLWTWGYGIRGQLGNNAVTSRSTPVTTFAGGTNWKQISAWGNAAAAIKTDGTLWTWGYGSSGRLGNNNTTSSSTPITTFAGGTNWKQISVGGVNMSAIKTDGTLWTWGFANSGRLGNNDSATNRLTPVTTFAGGTNWKQVSTGYAHAAAIKTDGTLWIWGSGGLGKLGTSDATNRLTPVTTFAGGTNWKQVSCGYSHTSAIKTDGTLWTWGYGSVGRLGTNDLTTRATPVTTFAGGTDWKQVSSGNTHTTAVKTDGTLWTWGNGTNGRLGTGNVTTRSIPVTTFAGGTNWKQVSAGLDHTLALNDDGVNKRLYVFGDHSAGELGIDFVNVSSSIPLEVYGSSTNWKQVSAGYSHVTAVKTDGTLWVWGNGGTGKLGTNDTSFRDTPVTTFSGGNNWKQVSSGITHTTAVKTDGTLWVWGNNGYSQLGNNDLITRSTPVTTFVGGTNWKQVSAGANHTLALQDDGVNKQLYVFGSNNQGQLGSNPNNSPSIPVQVFPKTFSDWKQVSVGNNNMAAIRNDGTLWTWGNNAQRQLGNNTFAPSQLPITTFIGGTNWKQVSMGDNHAIALDDDGTDKRIYVWGNATGLGIPINSSIPLEVSANKNWKDVSNGNTHTAAIKTDGTLWLWGGNGYGPLGDNTATNKALPVTTFAGGTNWKHVSAGNNYTVAVKTDGTLWTWGNGESGKLGTNNTIARSTPVTTFAGGTNWRQVSAGNQHTSAIKTDGTLWVWGNNVYGQLGSGDQITRSTPVTTFSGGTNWKQVSAGSNHTTAVKTDGTLWTWGNNVTGQLGNSVLEDRLTPVTTFAGGTNWKQVNAGANYTLALNDDGVNKQLYVFGDQINGKLGTFISETFETTPLPVFGNSSNWKQISVSGVGYVSAVKTDGTLWVWGSGNNGALGTNDTLYRSTPVTTFAGGNNWKQVSIDRSSYAIKTDGTLWTWGLGNSGQLGNNAATSRSTPVTTFAGGTNWKQVSAGNGSAGAVKTDGTLWTWGYGVNGQLGTNDATQRNTPVTTFAGGNNWTQVNSLFRVTTALKTDGTLWTWGLGASGLLGNNITTSVQTPVTTFVGGNNWKDTATINPEDLYTIATGKAIKTDGTLWTWGNNTSGELANNNPSLTQSLTPVTTFLNVTGWKDASAGRENSIATRTDNTLWTWGRNQYGQLGTNDLITRSTPVTTFLGGSNWNQTDVGTSFSAAIKTDGTLWTWGLGTAGRLGTNDTIARSTPVTTFAGGTNWKQLSIGRRHVVAIKTDGTLWVWGNGLDGKLGINDTNDRSTPVTTLLGGYNWKQISAGESLTIGFTYTDDPVI